MYPEDFVCKPQTTNPNISDDTDAHEMFLLKLFFSDLQAILKR